jgi:NADH:ubiquinone oxidoreductase subunit
MRARVLSVASCWYENHFKPRDDRNRRELPIFPRSAVWRLRPMSQPHTICVQAKVGGVWKVTPCDLLDSRKREWQNASMKTFLLRFFTWWNGQTFGTQLWTWWYGELVGEDEFGNRYYRTRGGKIDPTLLFQRRWVIYNGIAEPSMVPPSWHGWLHHTVDTPPTDENYKPRSWQKPHRPNLTGTPAAHRPTGSTLSQGRRPKATGDYKAWTPGR